MQYIIVSDIFGRTKYLENIALILSSSSIIVDPYQGQVISFIDEQEAYQYFTEKMSIEKYAEHLIHKLSKINEPVKIIAFSVGGSAAWEISEQLSGQNIHSLTCFYASQIRYNMDIKPNIPVNLILPKYEDHFSITQLAEQLKGKTNVNLESTEYLHGFMNELSTNYNKEAANEYLTILNT